MTASIDRLMVSVFETMGRAVSEDLMAASPDEAARGYSARLKTLSRLTSTFTSHVCVDLDNAVSSDSHAMVVDALDAIGKVDDARFWLVTEDAPDEALVRVAFAVAGVPVDGKSPLDVALETLASPEVCSPVTGAMPG